MLMILRFLLLLSCGTVTAAAAAFLASSVKLFIIHSLSYALFYVVLSLWVHACMELAIGASSQVTLQVLCMGVRLFLMDL